MDDRIRAKLVNRDPRVFGQRKSYKRRDLDRNTESDRRRGSACCPRDEITILESFSDNNLVRRSFRGTGGQKVMTNFGQAHFEEDNFVLAS